LTDDLADERYVRLTTWTADGRPKHTPVWIVGLAEPTTDRPDRSTNRVGFTTGSHSWKVRRILNNSAVELRASNSEGVACPESSPVTGTAYIVHSSKFRTVRRAIRRKYRLEVLKVSLQSGIPARLRGRGPISDCAVVVTVAD